MTHTFLPSTWEAEKVGLCEFQPGPRSDLLPQKRERESEEKKVKVSMYLFKVQEAFKVRKLEL